MEKKYKIGFFTDTYKPQVNGVVSSIELFRQELQACGHEVYVFCPKLDGQDEDERIISFKSFKFVFQPEYHISIPFSRQLLREFWTKELDIVHAHTPFSLGLLGYYYAYIKRVPFISTYHTLYPEYIKAYILKGKVITPKMVATLSAIFSNRCDLNIAPSLKIKNLLIEYGVTKPIEVLATGIKISEFAAKNPDNNFRQKYQLKNDDKILLYVGRLGKEKNILFLINSLKQILARDQSVKLVLVGDGPQKAELEEKARKDGLADKIIFTGYLNKEDVIKAYHSASLFVFASLTDTQGMVILEAAASSLPIIAIKDEAFSNILQEGKNGFFVEENESQFSNRVLEVLRDHNLYQSLSIKSAEIAAQYSIENQTQNLLKLYKQAIDLKR